MFCCGDVGVMALRCCALFCLLSIYCFRLILGGGYVLVLLGWCIYVLVMWFGLLC